MNSLIDCDKETGDSLMALTHMHPSSGFQYRTTTYVSKIFIVDNLTFRLSWISCLFIRILYT
jgi:hypothetical protein